MHPERHSFKKHLNCVPPDYKVEEAYKGKSYMATELPKLCVKNYKWSWQDVMVLFKQGLVGV